MKNWTLENEIFESGVVNFENDGSSNINNIKNYEDNSFSYNPIIKIETEEKEEALKNFRETILKNLNSSESNVVTLLIEWKAPWEIASILNMTSVKVSKIKAKIRKKCKGYKNLIN